MLRFNDGVNIDTSGKDYKIFMLKDGCYVVGRGVCIPVASVEAGKKVIEELPTWMKQPSEVKK